MRRLTPFPLAALVLVACQDTTHPQLGTPDRPALGIVTPPSGLVSWWPGDGHANDIVGGNNGTLLGGVSFSAAEVGQGFSFNSNSDGVTIPHNTNLDVQNPGFSADFWMSGIKNQPDPFQSTIFEKSHGFVDFTGWAFQVRSWACAIRRAGRRCRGRGPERGRSCR